MTTVGTARTGASVNSKKKKNKKKGKKKSIRSEQESYAYQLSTPTKNAATPVKGRTPSPTVFMSPASVQLERELGKAVKMLTKHIDVVSNQLNRASDVIAESTSLNISYQQKANDMLSVSPERAPAVVNSPLKQRSPPSTRYGDDRPSDSAIQRQDTVITSNRVGNTNSASDESDETAIKNDILLDQLIQNSLYAKIAAIYNNAV